jgi:hypothetical protein
MHTPMMREGSSLLGVGLTIRFLNSSMENHAEKVFMATSARHGTPPARVALGE